MPVYTNILPLLPVLPDVAAVLGWALQVLLFIGKSLLGGFIWWAAVEYVVKPLFSRRRRGGVDEAEREVRQREGELQREIGRLMGRAEAAEEAQEESDRRAAQYKAELERERRKPWWRKLLEG